MTTLKLNHIAQTKDSTVSELLLDGKHLCYMIEDGKREVKVSGETRIPAGRYEIFPRKEGGFFNRYAGRWGHRFVLGFKEVPGFTYILIHVGNAPVDTRGCLLCNTEFYLGSDGLYRGAGSTDAYLMLYGLFEDLFSKGPVFIDIDRGIKQEEPEEPITEEPEKEEPKEEPANEDEGITPKGEFGFVAMLLAALAFILNKCLGG